MNSLLRPNFNGRLQRNKRLYLGEVVCATRYAMVPRRVICGPG
jgi:hypothetical protein